MVASDWLRIRKWTGWWRILESWASAQVIPVEPGHSYGDGSQTD